MTSTKGTKFGCREYFELTAPKYIEWDFYKTYLEKQPPYGQLGAVVFLRTYSRFVPEIGRREKLAEVCLRVVEFSLDLDTVTCLEDKKQEAKELFDCLFNFRGFASGRAYWIAGTPQTKKHGSSAAWNCCYTNVDDLSSFTEVFYWLLLGAGVGFGVENQHISKLPNFYVNKTIAHKPYEFNGSRYPNTVIYPIDVEGKRQQFDGYTLTMDDLATPDSEFLKNWSYTDESAFEVVVGDSKEGWCNALRVLLHLMTLPEQKSITFNYSNIRPKGERLKTFGGRASGHTNILDVLQRCYDIITTPEPLQLRQSLKSVRKFKDLVKKKAQKILNKVTGNQHLKRLTSVNVLDLINSIGLGVVSGGVRRTAEIGLGDIDDIYFIEAKENLFQDESKAQYRATRVMSNNSVVFYDNPGLNKIREIIQRIRTNGEPGFMILGNAQKFDPRISGCNPCGTLA